MFGATSGIAMDQGVNIVLNIFLVWLSMLQEVYQIKLMPQ